jgi:predicted nuclease of predicted toxin-antitoxin system
MKLLLDQNISFRVTKYILDKYPGSLQVREAGLENATDISIRNFAKENDFTIVTRDDDFNKYNELFGPPPAVIWIRKGNLSNKEIADLLVSNYNLIVNFQLGIKEDKIGVLEII